jgi:hypothetical protein
MRRENVFYLVVAAVTSRLTDKQTGKQTGKLTDKLTDKHTDKQTDRRVDRQTSRQASRQTAPETVYILAARFRFKADLAFIQRIDTCTQASEQLDAGRQKPRRMHDKLIFPYLFPYSLLHKK